MLIIVCISFSHPVWHRNKSWANRLRHHPFPGCQMSAGFSLLACCLAKHPLICWHIWVPKRLNDFHKDHSVKIYIELVKAFCLRNINKILYNSNSKTVYRAAVDIEKQPKGSILCKSRGTENNKAQVNLYNTTVICTGYTVNMVSELKHLFHAACVWELSSSRGSKERASSV